MNSWSNRGISPFAPKKKSVWKQRLSIAYAFIAFNAFGAVVYACLSGKQDWADYYGLKTDEEKAVPPGRQWATTLGMNKNIHVYRMSGFTKVGEYTIKPTEDQEVKPEDK